MRFSSVALRRLAFVALVALLATVSMALQTQQPTDSVTLAWDPNPPGTSGYRIHVGTESRVYDETYDVRRATSFVFTDGVPGTRYYFAVTAYDAAGRDSPPSNEVSMLIGGEPEASVSAQGCAASVAGSCDGMRVRADTLGLVRGLAALPDGRVLFVENGSQVRVLGPRGLVASPSLSIDAPDTELTELVVASSFDRTAFVFVGTTERRRDGERAFRVIRYRLVQDTLGEGATIVGDLSFRGEHAPRFTVDDAGGIFIAMPGAAGARTDAYAGRVLRFAADGSVPEDHRGFSPILANGVPVPLDLDWDGHTVWVIGLDERSQPVIGRLLLETGAEEWPRPLSAAGFAIPPGLEVAAFDVISGGFAQSLASHAVIVDTKHRLHRVRTRDQESGPRVEALRWTAHGVPVDVTVGPLGSMHVVVETAPGAFAVVEVTERQ
jgi:hypothetical protein